MISGHYTSFILLIPFFLIRFGLPSLISRDALRRAAHFAPMYGKERIAYFLYQLSNTVLFVYMFFLTIAVKEDGYFYAGICIYLLGLLLCAISMINFSKPSGERDFSSKGLYRFSRNPIYVSYFIFFTGCALLSRSLILFGIILIFQSSAHWIIRCEERWCTEVFGYAYEEYMKRVRRYI